MDMPTVTDAHKMLAKLVGNWVGSEMIQPGPMGPGGPAEGEVTNTLAIGGFAVVQQYTQRKNGEVAFTGHGVFAFSPADNCYTMHWWDSFGFPPSTFRGTFDGDVLTLTASEQGQHTRASWNLSSPDRNVFRMEVSPDGSTWYPFIDGTYTRKVDAPAAPKAPSRMARAAKKKPVRAKAKAKPKAKLARKPARAKKKAKKKAGRRR
jgi:hypothetical protein